MEKYIHGEGIHNLVSPREVVPELIKLFDPKSVVDIGCGLGTFLYVFKELGVQKVLGIDGGWVNQDLLYQYLSSEEYLVHDLEKPIQLNTKFDLVLSLEVAEHLSENAADIFVKSLVQAGNIIVFSAAIPLQGGQNHLNEQWLTYWEEKFRTQGYIMHDIIRPLIWDNPKVFWWYKQNIVVLTPKEMAFHSIITEGSPALRNIIHYDLFEATYQRAAKADQIIHGKLSPFTYLKYLIKSIVGYKTLKSIKSIFKS